MQFVVAKGEGGGGWMDWEYGISRCKLQYIGWINSKVLLDSRANNTQYPVRNHKEKSMKKNVCVTIIRLHSRNSHNIVNQLYFNKIHSKRCKT